MADSLLLRAAIEYASLGLRVIPLHNVLPDGSCSCRQCDPASGRRGKHPRQMGWQRSASADPETIRSWWRSWPDANVGVATGRGLVVLDADGQEGRRTLLDLQRRHGRLPETALAVTGGGGLHYLFRTPAPVASATGANRAWPGLDAVGEGGLVVAAPSVHHSGARYRWVRQPGEGVAAVPGWLLTRLRGAGRLKDHAHGGPSEPRPCDGMRPGGRRAAAPARTPPGATETPPDPRLVDGLLKEMVERFPVTQWGERNARMYPAVASLVCRGYSVEVTTAVMVAWLERHRSNMRAGPEEARRLLDACVRCAFGSDALRPAMSAADHESLCRGIVLTPLQRRFLQATVVAGDSPSADCTFRRPADGRRLSLLLPCDPPLLVGGGRGGEGRSRRRLFGSVHEQSFGEAVIVHCLHKLLHTEEGVIRATNEQLRGIMRARHGLELHPQQFGRLKRKFVTRPDKPATRFELVRETVQGYRTAGGGAPPEYALTWLGWLFSQEEGTGAVWVRGDEGGLEWNLPTAAREGDE